MKALALLVLLFVSSRACDPPPPAERCAPEVPAADCGWNVVPGRWVDGCCWVPS